MNRFDPARPNFAPYGLTCERWTPSPMPRTDCHNEIELNLLTGDSLTYLLGGRRVTVPANRIAIFWAGIPHQVLHVEGEQDYFVATLPFAWFLQCRWPAKLLQPLLHAQLLLDPSPMPGDATLFTQWVADIATRDPDRWQIVLDEVQTRLKRLTLALPEQPTQTHSPKRHDRDPLDRGEQMALFIAQHYHEDLTVEQIAQSVGLHPNYAMNLFKRLFGTTLNTYLTQHRLMHAERLLVTTDLKILDVALESGFNSISRFNALFRQHRNCSPRQYRVTHHPPISR